MSLNNNLGIPDARAKEISKKYSTIIKTGFEKGVLSESESIEMILGMDLTDIEKIWLAYHVGGINRLILYRDKKDITIVW